MPELGKYAVAVLLSYGITLVLLTLVLAVTFWRGRAVRRAAAQHEGRAPR